MPALRTTRSAARPVKTTLPALSIVAPAPRVFTFPATHNLHDSPYSSPSNSPFEDASARRALSSLPTTPAPASDNNNNDRRTPPPLSSFTRTLWPQSVFSMLTSPSVSPSPIPGNAHRRPKKGDKDYIKRPENAFILFRRKCSEDAAAASSPPSPSLPLSVPQKKPRQADLSKVISQKWKALPAAERAYWEGLARERKMEHEMRYPDYVYRPTRSRKSASASADEPVPQTPQPQLQPLEVVLPSKGGSIPYQSVLIPNVHLAPGNSMDDSASLMSLLTADDSFDYLSNNGVGFETSPDFFNFKNLVVPPPPHTPCLSSVSLSTPPSPSSPLPPALSEPCSSAFSFSFSASPTTTPASPLSISLATSPFDPDATYTPCWTPSGDFPWMWGSAAYPNLDTGDLDFDLTSVPEPEFGVWATAAAGGSFDGAVESIGL